MKLNLPELELDIISANTAENITGGVCIIVAFYIFAVA